MRRHLLLLAGAFLLAGCGAVSPALPAAPAPGVAVTTPAPPAVGVPVSISIPALGVTDDIVPVGLAPDGSMQVPDVSQSGWYKLAAKPGEPGPAVIIGHVDYKGVPGALGRIGEITPGALITVKDAAGIERTFVTDSVTRIPKIQYMRRTVPLVFNPTPGPELRLVTCSGTVVDHSYLDNTVVAAHLITK